MRNDTFTADGEILAYSHYVPAASPNGRLLSLMAPVPPTVSALDISPSILFRVALAPFVSISRGMARVRRNFNNPVWSGARSRLKLQLSSCLSFRLSDWDKLWEATSHQASSQPQKRSFSLFCLALYGDDCIDVPFDEPLTASSRKPSSFENSSVRSDLRKFQGRSRIITGEEEDHSAAGCCNISARVYKRAVS